MSTPLYPLFLKLNGHTCVVVGGDEMAEAKVTELLAVGAIVRVISPTATPSITSYAEAGKLQWEARTYQDADLRDAILVVSVSDSETNARVFADAEKRNILCNAVDDVEHCNCYASAVVRRGPLQIAISTSGRSPALAQRLRKELESLIGAEYGRWVEKLGELRSQLLKDKTLRLEARRAVLHEQASAAAFESFCDWVRENQPSTKESEATSKSA